MPLPINTQSKSVRRPNNTTATMMFRMTPGSDRALFVLVNSGNNISGCTYDGVAMTAVGPQQGRVRRFYMIDPPVGVSQVVASMDGSGLQVAHALGVTVARVGNFP